MPTGTFEYRSESERNALERALAFVAHRTDLALSAPCGQVLDLCEGQALEAGRNLLQTTLQTAGQGRLDVVEEKKGRHASARAGGGVG